MARWWIQMTLRRSKWRTSKSCNSSRCTPKEWSTTRASMLPLIRMRTSFRCRLQVIREFWVHSKALVKIQMFNEQTLLLVTTRCKEASNIRNSHSNKINRLRTRCRCKWIKRNITNSKTKIFKNLRNLFNRMRSLQWRRAKKYFTNRTINLAFWIRRTSCWMLKVTELALRIWKGSKRLKPGLRVTKRWSRWCKEIIFKLRDLKLIVRLQLKERKVKMLPLQIIQRRRGGLQGSTKEHHQISKLTTTSKFQIAKQIRTAWATWFLVGKIYNIIMASKLQMRCNPSQECQW